MLVDLAAPMVVVARGGGSQDSDGVSLSERASQVFAGLVANAEGRRLSLSENIQALNMSPEQLAKVQVDVATHQIEVTLVSSLTRKALDAVDTVVKAQ